MATPARSASAAVVSGSPARTRTRAAATIAATVAALRRCCGAARLIVLGTFSYRCGTKPCREGRSRAGEGGDGGVEVGEAVAEDGVEARHPLRGGGVGLGQGGAVGLGVGPRLRPAVE